MTTTDAQAADGGALTVDDAVELLAGPETADQEDEAPKVDVDEAGDLEEVEPRAEWSADDEAALAELPPRLRAAVARHEAERSAAAAEAIEAASQARAHAEAQVAEAGALADALAGIVPQAEAAFLRRWGGEPDWAQVAERFGPEEAARLRGEFDQEAAALQQLAAANAEAERAAFGQFVASEFEKLKVLEPELAEGAAGGARRQAVVEFLAQNGVTAEQIRHIGAVELSLAYDALRYRLAMAGLAQSARRPRGRPTVVPAAAEAPRSSQQRRAEQSRSRFAQKPTIDNAVAAILAKG